MLNYKGFAPSFANAEQLAPTEQFQGVTRQLPFLGSTPSPSRSGSCRRGYRAKVECLQRRRRPAPAPPPPPGGGRRRGGIAKGHALRLHRSKGGPRTLRDQCALFLSQRAVKVQDERFDVRTSSATTNGTRCAIRPEMKCTSRERRSSFDTMTWQRNAGLGQGCRQLRATVERVRSLASLGLGTGSALRLIPIRPAEPPPSGPREVWHSCSHCRTCGKVGHYSQPFFHFCCME